VDRFGGEGVVEVRQVLLAELVMATDEVWLGERVEGQLVLDGAPEIGVRVAGAAGERRRLGWAKSSHALLGR
jgi:hypothetical protein